MEPIAVRLASLDDAAAICAIYNQGIEDRVATLETELRDADERRRWLSSRGARYPVVVAEVAGRVIAWASLNSFNPRHCYDHVADISVYVERSWRGTGMGRTMLVRLIELGRSLGFHKLVLACFPTNKAGVALYERLGFVAVGVYREQGLLDGRWVDVLIMEQLLAGGREGSSWRHLARSVGPPSAAGSTYQGYASPAAFGRRLASGPFSSACGRRKPPRISDLSEWPPKRYMLGHLDT